MLGRDRLRFMHGRFEARDDLFAVAVYDDCVAVGELAAQDAAGNRVLDHALNGPAQRTRSVKRVKAGLGDQSLGGVGDFQVQLAGGQLPLGAFQEQVHNLFDLRLVQGMEDNNLVDPV